jgi:hypothetical protein
MTSSTLHRKLVSMFQESLSLKQTHRVQFGPHSDGFCGRWSGVKPIKPRWWNALIFGNGAGPADACLAADEPVGGFDRERCPRLLTANTSMLTAIGND